MQGNEEIDALKTFGIPVFDFLVMVKPQFEVGRERLGKGGVVRDAAARQEAIDTVVAFAREQGLTVRGVVDSPVPGPAGNVEALLVADKP